MFCQSEFAGWSFILNSRMKYKCPCTKYTKMRISCFFVPKTVDRYRFGCYTLAINWKQWIDRGAVHISTPAKWEQELPAGRKGSPPKCSKLPGLWMLVRRKISAGLSQSFCEALSMAMRFTPVLGVCPYFHGPLQAVHFFRPDGKVTFRKT